MPKKVGVGGVLDRAIETVLLSMPVVRLNLMVVQAEATSTNANTGEMMKDSVECLAVLSDRIGSWSNQRW